MCTDFFINFYKVLYPLWSFEKVANAYQRFCLMMGANNIAHS